MVKLRTGLQIISANPHGGEGGPGEFDFSVSTNPYGPPPELAAVVASADISRYPARNDLALRQALAQMHDVEPDCIVLGAGTIELIYRLSAALLQPGEKVLLAAPTFNEFARAASIQGARVIAVECYCGKIPDASALLAAIAQHQPRLCWLCSPNNPSGHVWPEKNLLTIAEACVATGSLFCLDSAYSFVDPAWPGQYLTGAVQLFSPTKTWGTPGVRLGYALAPIDLAKALRALAPPWLLGAAAITAGLWSCQPAALDFVRKNGHQHLLDAQNLAAKLCELGLEVRPSQAGFFLLDVGDAAFVQAAAKKQGMLLRDCADFNLPNSLRIAARLPAANAKLLEWFSSAVKLHDRFFPNR